MRSLVVLIIIFGSVPFILRRSSIGIIMWSWIAYMAPHRLTWGIAYDMPVAMIVGSAAIVSWMISREKKPIPLCSVSVLMIVLILWCGVTTIFAINPPHAFYQWQQFSKIILMTLITLSVMRNDEYLKQLIWITTLSIGFYTVKGGLFTIITGGNYQVWGPPDTFIYDNNQLALATLMIIPLMNYLAGTAQNWWIKWGLHGAMLLSLASAVGSYSRGALLGIGAVSLVLWLRSRRKLAFGIGGVLVAVCGLSLAPQKWWDRMNTIETYEVDASANQRFEVWKEARLIAANRPVFGGGFGVFDDQATWERFGSGLDKPRNVHSIYFEMLGTQGYFGLAIFLALGASGFLTCRKTRRLARSNPELNQYRDLALMLECSLCAFAVSGTFLNLSTFDLYYNLLTMVVINHVLAVGKLRSKMAENLPNSVAPVTYVRGPPAQAKTAMPRSFLRAKARLDGRGTNR